MPEWSYRTRDQMLLVLISLSGGPKHGHGIFSDIRSFAGMELGPGTLYGAISRLEVDGMVEALEPEGRRRPYRLTARGADALARRLEELEIAVRTGRARLAEGER